MNEPRHITHLADELLSLILSFLLTEPESPDGREILHDYAFPPYRRNGASAVASRGEKSDLDKYRLVCTRFMRIATPWKFRRFTLRFSAEGFTRLNELVDMQLARHTRYFTYMVRPYYQGRDWGQFLTEIASDYPTLSDIHTARLADQTSLIKTSEDIISLKRALVSFTSLQQVKLLRLQDKADEDIMERARRSRTAEGLKFDWEPACSRAIGNLGLALMGSNCQSVRFLAPQLSPEAALKLLHTPRVTMSALGERLTCLDIYFHSVSDVTALMSRLSSTFRDFFQAARNLVTINVGFPANSPLNMHLEDVFHHIHWPRLRSLGIQGWRLHSWEIGSIARRHQSQLREMRLPYIYLLEGSRWRDVLSVLHDEMEQLEVLNLQHINYATHFDTEVMNGIEIPPGSEEEGEEEEEEEEEEVDDDDDDDDDYHHHHHQESDNNDSHDGDDGSDNHHSDTQSSSDISMHEITSETEPYPYYYQHRDLHTLTEQELGMLSVHDLGDNGMYVKREHWHVWEKWVVVSRRRI
ncbi:hypothetical protein UA08_08234 [Talaromyces atroroseus]|uniref:F-box domain-containing protein n=1 Tax=Talaromyces atroroseus TaxID=1441469 RepID=A0A225AHI3_TALAT|nr:hypothetical protein UA08_08234 [Talaromyces atroroseus]OKL56518.1 hypothetical protein UA08_08234 [Talaromyces atroroseus]